MSDLTPDAWMDEFGELFNATHKPYINPRPLYLLWSDAIRDVLFERNRQISVEGWTTEHDDTHADGQMAQAAAAYAYEASRTDHQRNLDRNDPSPIWPWDANWWKPTDRRRDLVKAAALIVAEIERLDRAEARSTPSNSEGV